MSDCLICCDAKQEFSFPCCSYSICLECKAKIEPQGKCPVCRTWEEGKSEERDNGAAWWYYEGLFDHFEVETDSETDDQWETDEENEMDDDNEMDDESSESRTIPQPSEPFYSFRNPRPITLNLLSPEAFQSLVNQNFGPRLSPYPYQEPSLLDPRMGSVPSSSLPHEFSLPPDSAWLGLAIDSGTEARRFGADLYAEVLDCLVEKASRDYSYNQVMGRIIRIAPGLHEDLVKEEGLGILQDKDLAKHEEQKARRRVDQRRLRISRLDRHPASFGRSRTHQRFRNFRNARQPRQRGRGSRR